MRRPSRISFVGIIVPGLVASLVWGAVARADFEAPTPTVVASEPRSLGLRASVGTRSDLVRSSGLDPFSTGDQLQESALAVGYSFGGSAGSALTLGLEWDHGSTSASARASIAGLTVDRLSVPIEGRMTLTRRLGVFVRLAPALLRDSVSVTEDSAAPGAFTSGPGNSVSFEQKRWVPAADASAGVAGEIFELPRSGMAGVGFWLTAEGGYGWAQSHSLTLRSNAEGQAGRTDEPLRLGELAVRGAFLRASAAISF